MERVKTYLRTCKACGRTYRSQFHASSKCPNCTESSNYRYRGDYQVKLLEQLANHKLPKLLFNSGTNHFEGYVQCLLDFNIVTESELDEIKKKLFN
jgi:hypothetical protein